MDRIVVVGNGIAGLTAAESVRGAGFDGELTIVGDEVHPAYSRPAISKAALLEDDPGALRLPEATHGATERRGVRAEAVDVRLRRVLLQGGETLPYDGLVIATGSRARRLSEQGPSGPEAELTLRGLDDMIRLRRRFATRPSSVVVVGSGPLAMEIASGALESGAAVTLVARGRPMAPHLGGYLADLLMIAAHDRGLSLESSGCLAVRAGAGHPVVELSDGRTVEAEVLVSAVGDLPNLEWLAPSGLLTAGALVVDGRGRVVVDGHVRPDIVAAGDVATFPTSRGLRRVPLWTSAIDQAKVAGLGLVRGEDAEPLDFRPYFWTEQFGLALRMSGEQAPLGPADVIDGDPSTGSALLSWPPGPDGRGTAAALNYRIPIPRLRRLAYPERTAAAS